MKILMAHARSNEEGKTTGGKAGDQTGREVVIDEFTEHSWQWIYRPKDVKRAEYIASNAEICAKNDNIGYDHPDRYSMYLLAKAAKYDFTKINKPCNTDCSQLTSTLMNGSGVPVSPYMVTANMRDEMRKFTQYFDEIPYTNKNQLQRGDALLTVSKGHVVIIVQGASEDPQPAVIPQWVGEVYGKLLVDVKTAPDAKSLNLKLYPHLAAGNLVDVCDEKDGWCYIRICGQYFGWLERIFLLRKTPYCKGTVTEDLHMRTNPGRNYKSLAIMKGGEVVDICDTKPTATGADWYYIIRKGVYGFASAKYIKKK